MYLGDKFRSPAKPSRCIDKSCLDLKSNFCRKWIITFQLHISEFESNSEFQSGGIHVFFYKKTTILPEPQFS